MKTELDIVVVINMFGRLEDFMLCGNKVIIIKYRFDVSITSLCEL